MKSLFKIFYIVFLFASGSEVYSQQITWQKILNNNYGGLYKAHQTFDSGYIAVGTDYVTSNTKIFLTKFNKFGDSLWTKLIGSNQAAHYDGNWIENTTDNGFIITGRGSGLGVHAYVVKTDSFGNLQWDTSFGGNSDQGYCIKQTFDKGFVILTSNQYNNIMLVKTDSMGILEWQKAYFANNNQFGREVIVLANGYGIIGGALGNMYFIRTNSVGDTLWTKQYGGLNADDGRAAQQTSDGGFILGGVARSFNPDGYENSYIVKTDSSGNLQWQRSYTATYKEVLFSVRTVPGNKYIFSGTTDSAFGTLERGFIRIIDSSGNIIEEKFYRALPYFTEIKSVEVTNDNGFILCGVTQQSSGGVPKMLISKTDSLGNILPVNIINTSSEIPIRFKLHQNYPNPFNPKTIINYELRIANFVTLKVFDITGKEVAALVNQKQYAGTYSVDWNAINFPSGVYFYTINAGEFKQTKRMILLK